MSDFQSQFLFFYLCYYYICFYFYMNLYFIFYILVLNGGWAASSRGKAHLQFLCFAIIFLFPGAQHIHIGIWGGGRGLQRLLQGNANDVCRWWSPTWCLSGSPSPGVTLQETGNYMTMCDVMTSHLCGPLKNWKVFRRHCWPYGGLTTCLPLLWSGVVVNWEGLD